MEQGQNMVGEQGANGMIGEGMPSGVSASAPEPSRTENMMTTGTPEMPQMSGVVEKPKKKNNAMMLAMILLVIAAAGGIGFGIWAMMDSNTQQAQLKSQINTLQAENSALQEQVNKSSDSEEVVVDVETDEYENPVIKSNDPEVVYGVGFTSSYYYDGNDQYYMVVRLKDGAVDTCSIYAVNGASNSNCAINGINGEVFKVVEFGEGQDNTNSNIGFIMTDGSVQYFPFIEAMKNKDFSIKGQLNINGSVVDILEISVGSSDPNVAGGYGSTVFVLNDGSFVKFDETMLE